jgi:hypothetical protein
MRWLINLAALSLSLAAHSSSVFRLAADFKISKAAAMRAYKHGRPLFLFAIFASDRLLCYFCGPVVDYLIVLVWIIQILSGKHGKNTTPPKS